MEENQSSFSGWARVEIMGKQTHIGFVRTESYGQAVLFRIDTPELPEREYTLMEPEYVQGRWAAAGSRVVRPSIIGVTVMVGSGSIYRIIPCTELAALAAIENLGRSELKLVEAAPEKMIQAHWPSDSHTPDDDSPEHEEFDDDSPI